MIFKFANHRTKEFFVSRANKPLVGTLMTIGDVTVSIAIAKAEGPSRTVEHVNVDIAIDGGSSLLKRGLEESFDFLNRVLHNKHLSKKSRAQLSR